MLNQLWNALIDDIRPNLDPEDIQVWLDPLKPADDNGDSELVLLCPNATHRRWVSQNFAPHLQQALRHLDPQRRLRLEVAATTPARPPRPMQMSLPRIFDRPPQFNQRFVFDNFVCGDSNQYAYAAAHALAGGSKTFSNTLFIISGTGLGKSHLTQAVGHQVLGTNPDSRVSYLTAEDFANQMVQALRSKRIEEFKDHYRRMCDILLLEEIQFLGGKMKTQDEIIYTLDALENSGKRIVFTSSAPPNRVKGLRPQLASRLAGGVTVSIDPPDHATRVRILKHQCKIEGVRVDSDVLDYLAQEVTDDVRRLHSALVGLIAKGSLTGRPMDLNLAAEVLGQMSIKRKRVTSRQIRNLVAKTYGLEPETIAGKGRARAVTHPRNLAMFLCRRHTDDSYAAIGKVFNRDHATVIYGVNKIDRALKTQAKLKQEITYLEQRLNL